MTTTQLYIMWRSAVRAKNWDRAKLLAKELDNRRTILTAEGK